MVLFVVLEYVDEPVTSVSLYQPFDYTTHELC